MGAEETLRARLAFQESQLTAWEQLGREKVLAIVLLIHICCSFGSNLLHSIMALMYLAQTGLSSSEGIFSQ